MSYDEQHDDGLGGRSRDRREITAQWRWGATLVLLPAWHLAAIPMPDNLRAAIIVCHGIISPGARKRQIMHIDSIIRDQEPETRDAIERAMNVPPEGSDPDSLVRTWVARLKDGGDAAIDEFVAAFPTADRQQVRQTARRGKAGTLERLVREYAVPG